jgi:hypothetical protein
MDGDPSDVVIAALRYVTQAIDLALFQVRRCVLEAAKDSSALQRLALEAWPRSVAEPYRQLAVYPLLWPLGLDEIENIERLDLFEPHLTLYKRDLEALRGGSRPSESLAQLVAQAFVERRSRATFWARAAFRQEKDAAQETFEPEVLLNRFFVIINLAEMAALVSSWQRMDEGASGLAVAASALRSALFLWLEDDNRAMTPVRTVLEMTARARSWRLKPDKASRLSSRNVPVLTRDWVEAAGWRRMGIFVRTLGELSHTSLRSRWSGAIRVLIDLQQDEGNPTPHLTARGSALGLVTLLLATEVIARLHDLSPVLAQAFQTLVTADADDKEVESILNHIYERRDLDFGDADFTGPGVPVHH